MIEKMNIYELVQLHKQYVEIALTEKEEKKLLFGKETNYLEPGDRIEIVWNNDTGLLDAGYLFKLPISKDDEDLFYHIPYLRTNGIGNTSEEFGHINQLLVNPLIRKIFVYIEKDAKVLDEKDFN